MEPTIASPDLLLETEKYLHAQIPITRAMCIRVESFAVGRLVVTAPLAQNHNHLGTAFGGSLAAVATLAGYALLWLELQDRNCHLVIAESTTRFRRPVQGEIRATAHRPEPARWAKFLATYAAKGKARVTLRVTIEEEGEVALEFQGIFVARR